MQRRVQQPHGDGQPLHNGEQLNEVRPLIGQQFGQRHPAPGFVGGQDHLPHMDDAFGVEEHMFGAAKANALGAEMNGGIRVLGRFRIGADIEGADVIHPFHQLAEFTGQFRLDGFHFAQHNLAPRAVDGDDIADAHGLAGAGKRLFGIADLHFTGAGDARPPHAAGHHGGVAGHAAPGGQDALGRMHAADIFRAGFHADQDDLFPLGGHHFGLGRGKGDFSGGRAGGGRQASTQNIPRRVRVQGGMQQLIELRRIDPADSFLLGDQTLGRHIDGDPEGRFGGSFAAARLQHPEFTLLDGELHVLHVFVMIFQLGADIAQFLEQARHVFFHRRQAGVVVFLFRHGQGLGCADARHHIFALGVDQIFAVKGVIAGGRVAGEADTGGGTVAHIAKHHGLNIDGGAPFLGNIVEPAVNFGPIVHPTAEDGADGAPQLVVGVLGKRLTQFLFHHGGEFLADVFPVVGVQIGIQGDALIILMIGQDILEIMVFHAQHHVAVHLDETAVAVIGETLVAAALGQPLNRLVVEAQVKHCIHHAGHGGPGAGADGNQ